ncbi:MAG: hypothetical protein WB588_01700 [Dehalococcoidia bacterium]
MTLEQRLKRIEIKLSQQPEKIGQPGCRTIFDLPKETVVGAFAIHKELFGGYHLILEENPTEDDIERYAALNQLEPEQFYDLMVRQGSSIPEAKK